MLVNHAITVSYGIATKVIGAKNVAGVLLPWQSGASRVTDEKGGQIKVT